MRFKLENFFDSIKIKGMLTIGLLIMLISFDFAYGIMQLTPPIQELQVQRGSSGNFTFTIANTGDEDSPSSFAAYDMDVSPDGRPFIADSGATRGCGEWITFDTSECIIKAHQSFTLKGKIKVPPNAEGGYYAVIKARFVDVTIPLSGEKVNIKGSNLGLESQALVALLLTVPSSRNKAELYPDTLFIYPRGIQETEDVSEGITFNHKNGWKIVMPLTNRGNIHTRVSGNISLWTEAGTRLESAPFEVGRGYVIPNKTRNLKASGENILADGYYMARITIQTADRATMSNSFAFAIYEGKTYPGASNEKIASLLKASAAGFSLKEPFKQRNITPGGSSFLPVLMVNTINDNLTLVPRKINWNLNEFGQLQLEGADSIQGRSAVSWTEFPEDHMTLLPGQSASFKIKINPPADIKGEYYAAIVFDSDKPNPDLPVEFMSGRTQLIALTTAKGLEYKVVVDSIKLKKESTKDISVFRFTFKIINTGNVHCFAAGNMTLEKEVAAEIYNKVGETYSFGDQQTYILPNGKRAFEIDVPNLKPGHYRAALAVNYKQDGQPVMLYQLFNIK